VATTEDEASNADVTLTTTSNNEPMLVKLGVDISPATTGTDIDGFGVSIYFGPAQSTEIDSDSIVDVVRPCPLSVATTAHSKVQAFGSQAGCIFALFDQKLCSLAVYCSSAGYNTSSPCLANSSAFLPEDFGFEKKAPMAQFRARIA
ncbi:hypothetical protein KCU73_g17312, partial [Aureobasidium melanogenum]